MIYLDVTSASASAVNMGVQRTVRGLHAHLQKHHAVTPVRWDFWARRYARLTARERNFLENPFASYEGPCGTPGRWDARYYYEDWKDALTRRQRGVSHETILNRDDLLLIPDLCWDPRIHAWSKLAAIGGRKIAVFHDAIPMRIPGQADSHDALFSRYMLALARLDGVICISQEVKDDLLGFWARNQVPPKPIFVLPWPVPFESERPQNAPRPEAQKVIYVARLKLRKNHLVLLAACEKLWSQGQAFALDLIGIEDAFTDTRKILREVRRLADRGHPVRWRKHISETELAEAYRDCSFTAFPSRIEGFGLPIIESLWHGRPVICGRDGAIGEVAAGGGCYQIDQNNADELASAIQLLLVDRAVYDRLYQEALHRSFRSWGDYLRDLDSVLNLEPSAAR